VGNKPKSKDHVSCLHLACSLCLREQESPNFSQTHRLRRTWPQFEAKDMKLINMKKYVENMKEYSSLGKI